MRAVCADIIAAVGTTLPAEPDDTSEPIAASNANDVNATSVRRDYGIADAVPGNEIDITEQEAATLIARFGRVYNTGVTVPSMTVSADLYDGEARDLIGSLGRTTAKLQYSDGSTAMRAVDWDAAQLAALADDAAAGRLKPGERRTVRGRIRQTDYPVPFAVERADPSVFAWNYNGEQLFMFIATDDTDGNCVDAERRPHAHAAARGDVHRRPVGCRRRPRPRNRPAHPRRPQQRRPRDDRLLLGARAARDRRQAVRAVHAVLRRPRRRSGRHRERPRRQTRHVDRSLPYHAAQAGCRRP